MYIEAIYVEEKKEKDSCQTQDQHGCPNPLDYTVPQDEKNDRHPSH